MAVSWCFSAPSSRLRFSPPTHNTCSHFVYVWSWLLGLWSVENDISGEGKIQRSTKVYGSSKSRHFFSARSVKFASERLGRFLRAASHTPYYSGLFPVRRSWFEVKFIIRIQTDVISQISLRWLQFLKDE